MIYTTASALAFPALHTYNSRAYYRLNHILLQRYVRCLPLSFIVDRAGSEPRPATAFLVQCRLYVSIYINPYMITCEEIGFNVRPYGKYY